MTNDAHIFVSTCALKTHVQVAYGDGHRVPVVWTGTVTLPATLPFMRNVVCMLERQTGLIVKYIVCDGGNEFMKTA